MELDETDGDRWKREHPLGWRALYLAILIVVLAAIAFGALVISVLVIRAAWWTMQAAW